jgi:hypothetical protein
MSKTIDYVFVIQRKGRSSLARILSIDSADEVKSVREVCERLKQGNEEAEIHYTRHPADDTIVIMDRFGDDL